MSNLVMAMVYELDNNFKRRTNTGIATGLYTTFETLSNFGIKPLLKPYRCYMFDVYLGSVDGDLLQSKRVTTNTLT